MVTSSSAPRPPAAAVAAGHRGGAPVAEPGPTPVAAAGTVDAGPSGYRPSGWVRLAPLIAWGMLAGAIGYVLTSNPTDRKPDLLGGCGWYAMFGTNGPTCGGTRMVWYLLHGDVVNAARMHLVWVAYAVVFVVYGAVLRNLPGFEWFHIDYMQAGIGL